MARLTAPRTRASYEPLRSRRSTVSVSASRVAYVTIIPPAYATPIGHWNSFGPFVARDAALQLTPSALSRYCTSEDVQPSARQRSNATRHLPSPYDMTG